MTEGEFEGVRAINGEVLQSQQYDEILRTQGFVPQHDILPSQLTVWQTLMYSALLRIGDKIPLDKKLERLSY
jgi:ABC-type multidrug transport system ATPase subunit